MKVLHVTDKMYPPSPHQGGAPQSLASLVQAQANLGFSVNVGIRVNDGKFQIKSLLGELLTGDSVRTLRFLSPDIIHFHYWDESLFNVAEAQGIPSIQHIRGVAVNSSSFRNAVFVSESHAKLHGKKEYVYNGLEVSHFPYYSDSQNYLVFLGKVKRKKKGVDTAVAVSKVTKNNLCIVGGRRFSVPLTWLPISRKVKSVGVLAGVAKLEAIGNARALLFPIRWDEPFGLVLIEAMACGVPVIAFNRGAVPEIVKDGETGFIVDDFNGMCAAVERIDEIDRAACRQHVADNFSIERTAKGIEEYYRRAIAGEIW